VATASAQAGAGAPDLAGILAERSVVSVAAAVTGLQAGGIARARESFVSFGTCSIDDPVTDLIKLGLIDGVDQR
jgi:hypothetical protein